MLGLQESNAHFRNLDVQEVHMQRNHSFPDASPAPRFIPTDTSGAMQRFFTLMLLLLLTAGLFCSAAARADQTPTTAPAMTITPTVGPPTTKVLVSGFGFDPYATVDIYFDITDLAQATTNAAGAFGGGGSLQGGIAVQAPASAVPGTHWIMALERSGQKLARKPFLVRTDWAQFHFGPDHNGWNHYENVLSASTVGGLGLRWSYQTGSGVTSSPAVENGEVYVGSWDNKLYALDASTGVLLWKYATGGAVESSPAVANGVVYFGSDDGNLYALNASTGALLWQYTTGGSVYSAPTVANGMVYFGSDDKNLYALNPGTGALLWKYTTAEGINSSPAVGGSDNFVWFGSEDPNNYNDGTFFALNASTGALVWSAFVGNSQNGYVGFSSPALDPPRVYVDVNTNSQQMEFSTLFCLGAFGGGINWQHSLGGAATSPAVANGWVYAGTSSTYYGHIPPTLYAMAEMGGGVMWQYTLNAGIKSSPAVANGVVYFGDNDGNLYALNANTGALLWSYMTGSSVESSPAVVNGVVYVGSDDGNVYAFGLTGGSH
jgi:outer membrane protein assembly factor BamB